MDYIHDGFFFQIRTAKMIAELGNLALTDPLTKIYNRRYLDLNLEKSSLFQNKEESMTLILFDIDYFKAINDTFGHNAGDMVLKKYVESLRKSFVNLTYLFERVEKSF